MKIKFDKHILPFKIPATTSRGAYDERVIYILEIEENGAIGIGECAPLPGLSIEDLDTFESDLGVFCHEINENRAVFKEKYQKHPAFLFGLESALLNLSENRKNFLFSSSFTENKKGIPINGLIWMSDSENLRMQIDKKIKNNFKVIKMKIGALDFDEECRTLEYMRNQRGAFDLEIRVDANGAFENDYALEKIKELSRFEIHSIEQPIRQGQWDAMQEVCVKSKIPVALDEELIGIMEKQKKESLIKTIDPAYLILKPTLLGGFNHCDEWVKIARKYNKGWWATSALESNIGLNSIAQWVATKENLMAQGLGTGQLFKRNFDVGLKLVGDRMYWEEN